MQQLAEWGVDAFKVDGCHANGTGMDVSYPALGRALNATGRAMIYSCSWPDYERSYGIPINWTLLAETCNSWRIFWDVQMGQFAHNQAERFDCVSGYLEFAATGSTEAAVAFSPNCPGDCHHGNCPRQVNHTRMLAAAGPGSFNDADMLPIGVKHAAGRTGGTFDAFTPIQARSAMALWVVLASPLMIGADVRTMDADSRSVRPLPTLYCAMGEYFVVRLRSGTGSLRRDGRDRSEPVIMHALTKSKKNNHEPPLL